MDADALVMAQPSPWPSPSFHPCLPPSSGSYDVTLMVLALSLLPVASPSLCMAAINC